MKPSGKVVVVTGGGNGISRAVAIELVRRGARVAAVDLRAEALDDTASLVDDADRLATYVIDITDRTAVDALPSQVIGDLGALDGVINVAGIIQPFVRLNDLDMDIIERVIDVNLYGTLNLVKAALPHLLERPVAHIANVASMGAFLPVPGQTVYGASKAAVQLLTEGLYAELRDTAVGVTLVLPGAVSTDITGNSGVEVPRLASEGGPSLPITAPEDAARMIADAIERDRLYVYVGKDSRALNIAKRLAPRRATHLIARQMKQLLDG